MADGNSKKAWEIIDSHREEGHSAALCDVGDQPYSATVEYEDLVNGWQCLLSPARHCAHTLDSPLQGLNDHENFLQTLRGKDNTPEHENLVVYNGSDEYVAASANGPNDVACAALEQPRVEDSGSQSSRDQVPRSTLKLFQLHPSDGASNGGDFHSAALTSPSLNASAADELLQASNLIQSVNEELVLDGCLTEQGSCHDNSLKDDCVTTSGTGTCVGMFNTW